MVIHQFNKLIRNKWVWGVFAVVVSAAFCFDDLFTGKDSGDGPSRGAGTLAGDEVNASEFASVAEDVRGLGRNRDWKRSSAQVNREAWEILAAIAVARANGIEATDSEVRETIRRDRSFAAGGQFSFALYERLLRENSITPERFEEFLRRRLSVSKAAEAMMEAASWVSPMEVDRAVADRTDTFTVRVARFTQTKDEADAVKLDDDGLRKWYDANTNSIALPERIRLRAVKFDATRPELLARMSVTEDDMRDRYDATVDRYTSTGTNGVETVKKFEEVKDEIEKDLRQIAAVQFYETNLLGRVYSVQAAKGSSRLDEIAKEDGLSVAMTEWFTLDGHMVEGFMKPVSSILPGADGLAEAVAELDSSSEDLRYGIVSSGSAVWLIERAETSPAHTPAFDEAKDAIRPRALRDARADAFKASVEAVARQGAAAVLAGKDVSTNITFAVCDMKPGDFPDQHAIAGAVLHLSKGEVSEFTRTGPRSALLVVCEDRVAGDAAKATLLSAQVRDEIARLQAGALPEAWRRWNLDRMGFEPNDISSVDEATAED